MCRCAFLGHALLLELSTLLLESPSCLSKHWNRCLSSGGPETFCQKRWIKRAVKAVRDEKNGKEWKMLVGLRMLQHKKADQGLLNNPPLEFILIIIK